MIRTADNAARDGHGFLAHDDTANSCPRCKREAAILGNDDLTHDPILWIENGHRRAGRRQIESDHTAADRLRTKTRQ